MKELAAWYEALWIRRAEPLTVKRIAGLRHETEALRNEYRALQLKLCKASQTVFKSSVTERFRTEPPGELEELFANASRFFICNTNRRDRKYTNSGGYLFEDSMHERRFAAAWEAFAYPKRMEEVRKGHGILMFAKGVGIIGIGVAREACETLMPGDSRRLYASDFPEWRVPVTWLAWCDEGDAFPWPSARNATFIDVSGEKYASLRQNVRNHFLEE
jgi:hypothetical protein